MFSVVALALTVVKDAPLHSFLRRERGLWFAAAALPMRHLYYLTGGLGILLAGSQMVAEVLVGPRSEVRADES
jgi:hypothetical protein